MNNFYKQGLLSFLLVFSMVFSPLITIAQVVGETAPVVKDVVETLVADEVTDSVPSVVTETPVVKTVEVAETPAEVIETPAAVTETPVVKDLITNLVDQVVDELVAPLFVEQEAPVSISAESKAKTFVEKVELGIVYKHKNNDQVQVTFTKLPENPGSLTIEEVKLTPAQVEAFGALSNIAYDITSDMDNGTFEYDLKLPAPTDSENISKVIYAETVEGLSNANVDVVAEEKVSVDSSDNTVSVSDLDHFTVYMVVRTSQNFSGLTWTADRQTPSAGWSETANTLVVNIDASLQAPGTHERTEGVQANIPAGKNSVKAKLYIDNAWSGVDYVRAGLWGKVGNKINPANNETAWPIMEFTNTGNNPRIRVYDTMVTGTWTDVGTVSYGDTVDFEVLQNPYTSKFEFYLNGILVNSYSSIDGTDDYKFYDGLILNSYNNGINDYQVTWSDLELGVVTEGPEIVSKDAYFVKNTYKGIGVDIKTDNLINATEVKAEVYRENGTPVVKTSKITGSVLTALNTGNIATITLPIVIQQGSYNEAGSTSWNQPTATWDNTNTPTKIVITITRSDGPSLIKEILIGDISSNLATLPEVMDGLPAANTPPTVTIESPTPAENSYLTGVVTLRATAEDDRGMGGSYLRVWKDSFESGGSNLIVNCQNAPGAGLLGTTADATCVFDTTTATDGVYVFSAQFIDSDNQWGIAKRTFLIDNTAPTIPSITKPSARQWFKNTPIQNEWTTSTDTTPVTYQVAYSYDDGHTFGGSTCSDVSTIAGKNVSGCRDTTSTSRNHSPDITEQGGVTIFVRSMDSAGNKSGWSEGVHYYYDGTAPVTDINVSPVVSGNFTVSGTATDNLELNRVYVQLVNRQTNTRVGGTTIHLIGTGTSSPWSVDYSGLPDGDYAAHVSATDMAGNSGTAGWTADFNVTTVTTTPPTQTSETIIVRGDTASAENELGWLFNRDLDNVTPFEFNRDTKVIGDGALYVLPIGSSNSSDKFIGEYFPQVKVADLTSFKFDFKLGASSDLSDKDHVYMNVYANFGSSPDNKYYDCKYDVVATTGSKTTFETVTFDPTLSYGVTTRADSPFACPSIPADMNISSPDSNIRAIAINLGDTSVNDADADVYFDNVIIETPSKKTTFDFEPTPIVIAPAATPTTETTSRRGRSGGRTGIPSFNSNSGGQVLGASTGLGESCEMYLKTYMKEGGVNDASEVSLLQTFLETNGFMTMPTGVAKGFFGSITKKGVIGFQTKYASEILSPWGITEATGNVFKSTRWKINNLNCDGSEDFPIIP